MTKPLSSLPLELQVERILTADRAAITRAYCEITERRGPRLKPERCPCGAMTAKRAKARRHVCEPSA